MKTLRIWMLSCLLLGVVPFGFAQDGGNGKEVKIKTSAVCGMCKAKLEKGLASEAGVNKAILDIDSKVLTLFYNGENTSVEKLRKAVNDLGYDADKSPATPQAYDRLAPCCKESPAH